MRTIKFRGQRVDNKEWVYGDLIHSRTACQMWINTHNIECAKHTFIQPVEVIPETVGQFTGLVDKDGVEIYEGDKVNTRAGEYCQGVWEYDVNITITDIRLVYQDLEHADTVEVIGNIHDNPELMERSEI